MNEPNGVLRYRVESLEARLKHLDGRMEKQNEIRQSVAVLTTEFNSFKVNIIERLDDLEESVENDVKGLRRILITFSITVAGSAVAFAITTLVVFGAPR